MDLTLTRRIGLYALVFAIQSLYMPLNHGLQEGVIFNTRWDAYIPLWPLWVVPYALYWPLWLAAYAWAALRMEEKLYRALIVASVLATATAISTFALYPTYVIRPALVGTDWATEWMRILYATDGVFNAFPSGHVYLTTVLALFFSLWHPRWRWVWAGFVVVVILSTLFTAQHYLPDIFGGLGLAWASYRVGVWWMGLENVGRETNEEWRPYGTLQS
ncbi:MAG: phosphatase PAP2 family protein [Caldilineaceae bacterium]|nr:phosphatase PAP2 family protein [Caldilineaceae bacterium]HRJ43187.1 phosphatase PAP2 family protein [Caldilineaceae bacterium]